jgi:uncharacterized protein HemX
VTIGVVVGILSLLIAIGVVLFLILFLKRRRKQRKQTLEQQHNENNPVIQQQKRETVVIESDQNTITSFDGTNTITNTTTLSTYQPGIHS